jgi:hypothetical protein
MNTLQISLRCLGHPASLMSIGLLLLNDHVLKAASPSWLTGKLSDFAGLFFFPFLLALVLGLILDGLRVPARATGKLAFGLTAIWFVLIKTAPWANALTEDLVSGLLGIPARIVLDPTDLIALSILWPARQVWIGAGRAPSAWVKWVGVGMAALATMASSCPPIEYVQRVFVVDGMLYTGMSYGSGSGRSVAQRAGNTQAWTRIDDPPAELAERANQTVGLPLTVCDPSDSRVCYRISGDEQVERSTDGGNTWQVDWQIPPGRRAYMGRYPGGLIRLCAKPLDVGPYDMAFVDEGTHHTLVVAAGNEGVLARQADGSWRRDSVLSAQPTPFAAQSLGEAVNIMLGESGLWLVAGVLALIAFSFRCWGKILDSLSDAKSRRGWATRPARFAIWFLVACAILVFLAFSGLASIILAPLSVVPPELVLWSIALIPPTAILVTWSRVAGLTPRPGRVWKAAAWCVIAALAAWLSGWSIMLLWPFGVIAEYGVAFIFGIAATAAALGIGIRLVDRASRLAAMPLPTRDNTPA